MTMRTFIFGITLLASAALSFSVQPMLGRMMLPHVGGAPAGWAIALAFFQAALLVGYGLSHALSRLPVFWHTVALMSLLGLGGISLPIVFATQPLTYGIHPWSVFWALLLSVGAPFVALSALTPGLQRLFSVGGYNPYPLYAASNAGSFLGLLAYPLAIEPMADLSTQALAWSVGYAGVLGSVGLCLFVAVRGAASFSALFQKAPDMSTSLPAPAPVTWRLRLYWLCLAAIPSSLIAGVTTHITTDISPVPMLWVLPLALYLLAFILAFAERIRARLPLHTLAFFLPFGVALLLPFMVFGVSLAHPILLLLYVIFILSVFFGIALTLHVQLAQTRPHPQFLTDFYFMIALGGALGGSFNAFFAPFVFDAPIEFPLVLLLALLFLPRRAKPLPADVRTLALWGPVILILGYCGLVIYGLFATYENESVRLIAIGVLVAGCFLAALRPPLLVCSGVFVVIMAMLWVGPSSAILQERNLFGVSLVSQTSIKQKGDLIVRYYKHGSTLHGMQALREDMPKVPLSYYAFGGPLESVFAAVLPKRVLTMGLGAGSIACYTQKYPEAVIDFIDIDPLVITIAKTQFSFLSLCPPKQILVGDARLVVEAMPSEPLYDLMIIDTFSSDAIPHHIITQEALTAYRKRLTQEGVILVHISNRYIDLRKPLAGSAKAIGLAAYAFFYSPPNKDPLIAPSQWVALVVPQGHSAKRLDSAGWIPVAPSSVVWRDAYTDILRAIKFRNDEAFKVHSLKNQPRMTAFIAANRPSSSKNKNP